MKSFTPAWVAQPVPQVSRVWSVFSATLPLVALIAIVPVASGVGSGTPEPAPAASWIRKYLPGAMLPVRLVFDHDEPVDDAYCTDQPVMVTVEAPRLNNSMKSFVYCAPVLPPPPYTWLTTMSGETALAAPGNNTSNPMDRTAAEPAAAPRSS